MSAVTLDQIEKDVFDVGSRADPDIDLALTTLRVAIRAYLSTYEAVAGRLEAFADTNPAEQPEDWFHGRRYVEAAAETIVHFQHFAELVCKHYLRSDHPLLADQASTKAVQLHKLLHGKALTSDEQQPVGSIEFSETIERLKALIKSGELKDATTLQWLIGHMLMLSKLNTLRNRIWHRGKYVPRYKALDRLVGAHVLPFVRQVVSSSAYQGMDNLWASNALACGWNVLDEIEKEACAGSPDFQKIAFLKATGAAAYESPLRASKPSSKKKFPALSDLFDERSKALAITKAEAVAETSHAQVVNCHVCGVRAMVVFSEIDSDDHQAWEATYQVECECCGFRATPEVGNPAAHGLAGVPDMWVSKGL